MAWLHTSLLRLREGRIQTAGLMLLVLVTAFTASLAPRVVDYLSDTTLRAEIAVAAAAERNIQLIEEGRIAWTGDAIPRVVDRGAALERTMPEPVRELIAARSFVIESPRWRVATTGKPRSTVRFRVQPGADERVQVVAGRLPVGAAGHVTVPGQRGGETREVDAFEAALSVTAAARLGVEVGETIELIADVDDRMAAGHLEDAAALVIVGTFEVGDVDDPFWLDDSSLAFPSVREISSENAYYDATVLLGEAAYDPLMRSTASTMLPMRYTWRSFIDPDRLEGETADDLLVELRRLEARYGSTIGPATQVRPPPTMRTGLRRLVEAQRTGWRAAESALTVVGIGPLLVAVAAVALVTRLTSQRRRATLALTRGRGASWQQVTTAIVVEGLLLTVPVTLVAVALSVLVLPTGPPLPTVVAALFVTVVTIVLMLAASIPSRSGQPSDQARDAADAQPRAVRPRRLVGELLLLGLALGGMWLMRERGVRGASSAGELASADPFIAAVPALAAVAAGLIAIRVFPLPMRLLAAVAAFRRDLVPVLAMRRATRGSAALPILLVLLGTATVAAFSSATLTHLERAAEVVAWQEVGATYQLRTTGQELAADLDPSALPGVIVASTAYRSTVPIGSRGARVELLAIEPVSHAAVVQGTGAATLLPGEFSHLAGEPIPAIVSRDVGPVAAQVGLGDEFELSVEGRRLRFLAVSQSDSFPGLPIGSPFVVAVRQPVAAAVPDGRLPVTTAFIRAPDSAADALRAAVAETGANLVLESRAERSAALRASPITVAVTTGVAIASIVAALYAALAVAAALALAGAARALEMAHLRTLGLTRREAAGLGLGELGPTVAVSFTAGVALGLGLFLFLENGLGLTAIVGATPHIPLRVDPAQLALVLAGIVMIMVVGVGLSTALGARLTTSTAVRKGIE